MKRLLSFIPALAFVLVLTGSAFGQTTSATISANAEVATNISAEQVQDGDLNFGIISSDFEGQNTPPTVNTDGTTGGLVDAGDAQVGLVSISGQAGETVVIETSETVSLDNSGTSITLTPSYDYTDANGQTGTLKGINASTSNSTTSFDLTLDSNDGESTIIIGGTLSENEGGQLPEGTYSGTITLNIDYSTGS
ncbi:hypothetical protein ACG2F4_06235 [Halalkalibaculum sp. DA3122]|uniref:hypothetical protein n=1 Tax=Halalkalibaculum sp. DA3122 TaxID=3373607 RepID=UPI0037544C72